jgi:uncharacterized membrane protein YidH (DUF202 family)
MNQEISKEKATDIATSLAHDRTDFAMTRTRMASERTLMAWIRTSLSMISFGFTILKFFEYLQQSQGPLGKFHGQRARHFGLALISFGILILIPAIFQNRNLMKSLSNLDDKSPWSLSLVVAILLGGFGLFALLASIFEWFF